MTAHDPLHSPQNPPSRPLLLIDGQCGFCRRCAQWLASKVFGSDVDFLPYQETDPTAWGISTGDCGKVLHAVTPDGEIRRGSEAIAVALRASRAPWPLVAAVLDAPVARTLAQWGYTVISSHRGRLRLPAPPVRWR